MVATSFSDILIFFLFQTKYIIKFWKTKQIYYQTISHIGFNGTKYLMLRIMLFFKKNSKFDLKIKIKRLYETGRAYISLLSFQVFCLVLAQSAPYVGDKYSLRSVIYDTLNVIDFFYEGKYIYIFLHVLINILNLYIFRSPSVCDKQAPVCCSANR